MAKYTEIVERGVVVDPATGVEYQTKTTMWPSNKYVPWIQIGRNELLRWIECFDSPKDKVKAYIIKNVDAKNNVSATCEKIAKEAGVGINTVSRAMSEMAAADLIKQVGNGSWMLNPRYFFQSKMYLRESIQQQYDSIPAKSTRKKV